MPAIDPDRSILLVVDFQSRLMPAIEDGATVNGVVADTEFLAERSERRHRPVVSAPEQSVAFEPKEHSVISSTQPCGTFGYRIQYRL